MIVARGGTDRAARMPSFESDPAAAKAHWHISCVADRRAMRGPSTPSNLPMPKILLRPSLRVPLPMALAMCAAALAVSGCGGDDSNAPTPGALVSVAALAASAGASGVVVADAPLPRPSTTPCTIELYSGMTYSGFDAHPFSYAGSAACSGAFSKVVLEA